MAFVLRKAASAGDPLSSGRATAPAAPGAVRSPQIPGEVPDRSSVPDQGVLPVPAPTGATRRPLTEYTSAQGIMGVYAPTPGKEDDPARFEQATVSYEELRKANPALRTPARPSAGYALADGARIANPDLASLSEGANSTGVDE
jgi:hypothetical protein